MISEENGGFWNKLGDGGVLVLDFVAWWEALVGLLFPRRGCLVCGEERVLQYPGICGDCDNLVRGQGDYVPCRRCATFILEGTGFCGDCLHQRVLWFDYARAVLPYEGHFKVLLRRFKYGKATGLARVLGSLMGEVIYRDPGFSGIDLVIPVPLHPLRLQVRGYNQAELLSREIARGLKLPVGAGVLIRQVDTPSQTGLSRKERQSNLVGAFALISGDVITNKNILLVDDIYTTGATVNTCARVLKEGGAARVDIVVCAGGKIQ